LYHHKHKNDFDLNQDQLSHDRIYNEDVMPEDCVGMTYEDQTLTNDLLYSKLLPAFEATEFILDKYNIDDYVCEEEVEIDDNAYGTSDMIGCGSKVALVLDYKFGHGIVGPDSDQNHFYAYGGTISTATKDMFDNAEKIVLCIIQPIEDDDREDYTLYETTLDELKAWVPKFLAGKKANETEGGEGKPGDWCNFCPGAAICPHKTGAAFRAKQLSPDVSEQLEEAMSMVDALESWCETVRKTMHAQLEAGTHHSDNWKRVNKRATRKWTDELAARNKIKKMKSLKLEDCSTTKMCTPPQLEKVCKRKKVDFKQFSEFYDKLSSGTTLADIDDKRPAIPALGALMAAIESN